MRKKNKYNFVVHVPQYVCLGMTMYSAYGINI